MHIVKHPVRQPYNKKMYLPHERMLVTDEGLAGFKIGKAFKRLVKITPRSFQPKNIFGAIGSATSFAVTGGLSSALAPKIFSAHSKTMRQVGMGVTAAAVAVGAVVAAPAIAAALPSIGSIGSGLATFGKGAVEVLAAGGKGLMGMFGGGKGGGGGAVMMDTSQGQMIMPQPIPEAPPQAYTVQQQQQYIPQEYMQSPVGSSLTPTAFPTMPDTGVSPSEFSQSQDLQEVSPYSQLKDVGTQPTIMQAGMFPQLSTTTWVVIGGVTLIGMYMLSGEKKDQ